MASGAVASGAGPKSAPRPAATGGARRARVARIGVAAAMDRARWIRCGRRRAGRRRRARAARMARTRREGGGGRRSARIAGGRSASTQPKARRAALATDTKFARAHGGRGAGILGTPWNDDGEVLAVSTGQPKSVEFDGHLRAHRDREDSARGPGRC